MNDELFIKNPECNDDYTVDPFKEEVVSTILDYFSALSKNIDLLVKKLKEYERSRNNYALEEDYQDKWVLATDLTAYVWEGLEGEGEDGVSGGIYDSEFSNEADEGMIYVYINQDGEVQVECWKTEVFKKNKEIFDEFFVSKLGLLPQKGIYEYRGKTELKPTKETLSKLLNSLIKFMKSNDFKVQASLHHVY